MIGRRPPHIPRLFLQNVFVVSEDEARQYLDIVACACDCHKRSVVSRDAPLAKIAGNTSAMPLQQRPIRVARAGSDEPSATPAPQAATASASASAASTVGSPHGCRCKRYTSVENIWEHIAPEDCAWASVELAGTRNIDAYVDALVAAMTVLFSQQHGISPQEVCEYHESTTTSGNLKGKSNYPYEE